MKIMVGNVRNEKGMTMRELHDLSGVALSHIQNIENGIKVPSITVLCKIARPSTYQPASYSAARIKARPRCLSAGYIIIGGDSGKDQGNIFPYIWEIY